MSSERMISVQRFALGLWLAAASGCVSVREGHFACDADSECPSGWVCANDGRCYSAAPMDASVRRDGSAPSDEDRDGVDDAVDCDPEDAAVGRTATRSCTTDCGRGEERCEAGVWARCDAPRDCNCPDDRECVPEDVERESEVCEGACGQRTRTRVCQDSCSWGPWGEYGACEGGPGCMPGAVETESAACDGACGTRTRARTCDATCAWGAWGEYGACEGGTGCVPGTVETTSRGCTGGCGTPGTQEATRTCTASCEWGAWSDFGACHDCAPATESHRISCSRCGTQPGTRSCNTASCTWGEWSYGACEGQGVCDPGDESCISCGALCPRGGGRRSALRTCSSSCTWIQDSCGTCNECDGIDPR